LAEFRRQREILEREIDEAKRLRDENLRRLNQTQEALEAQRREHQRRVNELNAEIHRLKQALVDLER
jgi:F0F1-type ATP synthase membrane subunit b/b'